MGELKYSVEAARQLEALYMMRDVVAQPAWTLNWLHLSEGERIIDIGCGSGFLNEEIATSVGPSGQVLGVAISEDFVGLAGQQDHRSWL